MVSDDEMLLTIQTMKPFLQNGFLRHHGEVPKNVDDVSGPDTLVPVGNQNLVHLLESFEWPVTVFDDVLMAKM